MLYIRIFRRESSSAWASDFSRLTWFHFIYLKYKLEHLSSRPSYTVIFRFIALAIRNFISSVNFEMLKCDQLTLANGDDAYPQGIMLLRHVYADRNVGAGLHFRVAWYNTSPTDTPDGFINLAGHFGLLGWPASLRDETPGSLLEDIFDNFCDFRTMWRPNCFRAIHWVCLADSASFIGVSRSQALESLAR